MPKRFSSAELVDILEKHGFVLVSQRGSHQKFRDATGRSVIVPAARREIPSGTVVSIIRQSGLDRVLFR